MNQPVGNQALGGASHVVGSGVRCQGLTVSFGSEQRIINELSLEVQPGEIVSLLGPSGCGKSTLLRAIAGLQEVEAGEVQLGSSSDRKSNAISFVFQDATLLPWRTVSENVRLPLQLGVARQESGQRIEQVLQQVGLAAEHHRKFPGELSGGMRMRTSLARALITDPDLLLLDEPFAALDDMLRTRLNELLLDLWQERMRTILFVTHNISEALFLSHRIAIMSAGKIAHWLDIPWEFPRNRELRFTAEFGKMFGKVSGILAESAV